MDDWRWMSAADLGRGIGAGEIDPVALTETFLAAIEAHPDAGRIYARLTPDRARAEAAAAAARAAAGRRLSQLDGVPVSWKDLFDSAGTATEAGTAMCAGRVPDTDAAVLRTATAQGLVCLGKTHLSEIAFSGLGLNPVTATPPNRHDPDLVPGGSSSGSALSVAFGLAAATVGTDTGGSVRIPAAWNDIVGLKTTHGLLPEDGVVPLCRTFDTTGPLTRTVQDAALMLGVLQGREAPDLRGATLEGTRFLVIGTVVMAELEAAPAAAFGSALDRLAAAGARIESADWAPLAAAYDLAGPLYTADAWAHWRGAVADKGGLMFHHIRERVSAGADVTAADYIDGWTELRRIRAEYAAFTAGYDAVLCPAAPLMPPRVDRLLSDDAYYRAANLATLRNTRLANLMGLCSLALPTGVPSCGILLNAAPFAEARLLRLGAAAEAALA